MRHPAKLFNILGIPNSSQSPDIGQNSDGCISNFPISGHSPIKVNCHNSRITDDIDLKLGPVTKIEKRNKTKSSKFDDNVMLTSCDVIVIFSIYGQFGAIWKPDFGRIICKIYIFLNSNLFRLSEPYFLSFG